LNSDDLRVFLRIAEAQSLSRAAAVLRLPKSSVSRQLARLEADAGAALVERGRGGVRLTDAGRVLHDHAIRVVELLDGAAASVQAALATPRGVLRVNVPHLFATNFLAARLPEFLRDYPEVDVVLDVSSAPAGALVSETDVIVRVGPLEDSALIARRLGVSELRLYAAPAALAGLDPAQAAALLEGSGLLEQAPLGRYRTVVAFEQGRAVRRIEALEPLVRHGLVTAGAGAAWLPAFLCRAEVAAGRLVELTPGLAVGPIPVHALYTAQAATSPKLRAFVGFLARVMDKLAPPAG
jgi:DNA-binding transcriptional LysR family regulator